MRTYISLTEAGARVRERMGEILPLWERYRSLRDAALQLKPVDGAPGGYSAAAVFDMSIKKAQEALWARMGENQRVLAAADNLTATQMAVLTLRYVQGMPWARVSRQLDIPRARLFQEHRNGLNALAQKDAFDAGEK